MQNWPSIFQAGTDFVFQLIDGLVQAAPGTLQAGIDLISSLLQTIYSNAPQFISSGFEVVTNLISGIIQRIPDLVDTAINMITNLVTTIWNNLPQILNAGVEIISSLIKGLVQMIPEVLGKIGEMGGNIVSSLGKIDLWAAGKAIIDGFLGGLKAAWGAVTDFIGGVANWIRDHKGPIEYDRKLLIPAGNAIMEGLDQGLQEQFKDVKQTVGGMVDEISDVFSGDDMDLNSSVHFTKILEAQLAMPSTQFEAHESKTVSEIANLRASMERILTAILEKSSDVYLDNDIISLKTYEQHGAIYAREGI